MKQCLRTHWLSFLLFFIAIISFALALCSALYTKDHAPLSCLEGEVKSCIKLDKSSTSRYISKFEFEGHTYLVLSNSWSSAGDSIIHDHNCKCFINVTIK